MSAAKLFPGRPDLSRLFSFNIILAIAKPVSRLLPNNQKSETRYAERAVNIAPRLIMRALLLAFSLKSCAALAMGRPLLKYLRRPL
jgi:hypothetical protein